MTRRTTLALLAVMALATPAWPSSAAWSAAQDPDLAVFHAMESLAAACEKGDRAALLRLVPESRRRQGAAIANLIVAAPGRPAADVRAEVVAFDGRRGVVVLTARTTPAAGPELPAAPEDGFATIDPAGVARSLAFTVEGSGPGLRLDLAEGQAANVRRLAADLVLEPKEPLVRGTLHLELTRTPGAGDAFLLSLPAGAIVRPRDPRILARAFAGGPRGGALLVRRVPVAGDTYALDLDLLLAPEAGLLALDGRLYLDTQWSFAPFAQDAPFLFDATLDVPEPYQAVSVGRAEALPSPPGRRRTRYVTETPIDLAAIGVAAYRVDRLDDPVGRLELWRYRDVGGPAPALLEELRDLLRRHVDRVGPLPHGTFRLAEMPTTEGMATSRAALIFMPSSLLATRESRQEILSHEVAHQWWGNSLLVWLTANWASEGMADYMKDCTVLERFGRARYQDRLDASRKAVLDRLGASSGLLSLDTQEGSLAYSRGSLFVHALADALGEDTFGRVLRGWFERFRGQACSTAQLRQAAEEIAGRPLEEVFGAWLDHSALPLLSLTWTAGPEGVAVTIDQEEPYFELGMPVRLVAADGSADDRVVRVAGARTQVTLPATTAPARVLLDPDGLTPRVRDDEIARYRADEAEACLARGEVARARGQLELLSRTALLDRRSACLLYAARILEGADAAQARRDLDAVIAESAEPGLPERILVTVADTLLAAPGGAAAARALLETVDARLDDGAAVPYRLGVALRQLGDEAGAVAAFQRARARRPDHAGARLALGVPTEAAPSTSAEGWTSVKGVGGEGLNLGGARLRALPGGRALALQPSQRRLLMLSEAEPAAVPGWSVQAPKDLAVLDEAGPVIAVLDAEALRSRVLVMDLGGGTRVLATHENGPAQARRIEADGEDLLIGIPSGDDLAWHRLGAARTSSVGPDDEDGLKRLLASEDPRLQAAGTTGAKSCVVEGQGLAWVDGSRVVSRSGTLWESLATAAPSLRAVAAVAGRLAVIVESDASRSPLPEDALPRAELVMAGTDGVTTRPAPSACIGLTCASDGTVLALVNEGPARPPSAWWTRVRLDGATEGR